MELTKKYLFQGRNFISLAEYTSEEISYLLDIAKGLKAETKARIPHPFLQGKTLGMIFTKASTRTRIAFEVGIFQLGGQGIFLSNRDIQLGRGETIKDTAKVLSRMIDGIMIRTSSHQEVLDLATYSSIPVINGLTDLLHPTQVLADLQTIVEYKGFLKGLKLAFIGDGNNVANSLMIGGAKMGMHIVVASPEGYKPKEDIVSLAQDFAKESGGCVEVIEDPTIATYKADVIYTDVWASMGQENELENRKLSFVNHQVNENLLKSAKTDAIVMHCLPAHWGEEITQEVLEGPQSVVFDQAENRLHAHKAIMALLM